MTAVPRRAVRVEVQDGTPRQAAAPAGRPRPSSGRTVDERGVADFDDTEDTVGIPVAPCSRRSSIPTDDGGSLWDPLPVTLPTYVTKPQAKRTVRTIDLGEPGTWTLGPHRRGHPDRRPGRRPSRPRPSADRDDGGQQRAVGS